MNAKIIYPNWELLSFLKIVVFLKEVDCSFSPHGHYILLNVKWYLSA